MGTRGARQPAAPGRPEQGSLFAASRWSQGFSSHVPSGCQDDRQVGVPWRERCLERGNVTAPLTLLQKGAVDTSTRMVPKAHEFKGEIFISALREKAGRCSPLALHLPKAPAGGPPVLTSWSCTPGPAPGAASADIPGVMAAWRGSLGEGSPSAFPTLFNCRAFPEPSHDPCGKPAQPRTRQHPR